MEESAWATPYGRLLAIACSAAAVVGFLISANAFSGKADASLGENMQENYENAADNLEAAALEIRPPMAAAPEAPPPSLDEVARQLPQAAEEEPAVNQPVVDEGMQTEQAAVESENQLAGDE